MDFKKYLVVLVFFIVGIVVGRNMPNIDSQSNTAATTTGSRTVVAPTTETKTPITTTTGTNSIVNSTTTNPYDVVPVPTTTKPTTTTTTVPTDARSLVSKSTTVSDRYAGINPLTVSLSRGSFYNDRSQVVELQKFLIAGGFLVGSADGSFGPMTQQAVIKFQLANKISPSVGYVGPITRAFINEIINDPFSVNRPNLSDKPCTCTNESGNPGRWGNGDETACHAADCSPALPASSVIGS